MKMCNSYICYGTEFTTTEKLICSEECSEQHTALNAQILKQFQVQDFLKERNACNLLLYFSAKDGD